MNARSHSHAYSVQRVKKHQFSTEGRIGQDRIGPVALTSISLIPNGKAEGVASPNLSQQNARNVVLILL